MTMTIAQLEAEVLKLRRDVGNFDVKPDTSKPAPGGETPGGLWPAAYRQQQLGEQIDNLGKKVEELMAKVAQTGTGNAIGDTLRVPNIVCDRLCIGMEAVPGIGYGLFIGSKGAAAIYMQSDMDNNDGQRAGHGGSYDPTAAHMSVVSMNPDASWKVLFNVLWRDDGSEWCPDPSRPWAAFGPNSMGQWEENSGMPVPDPAHPGQYKRNAHHGQKLVHRHDGNDVWIQAMQAGAKLLLQESDPVNTAVRIVRPAGP